MNYRKPNNEYTNDPDEYANAWVDLGNKLCIALGDGWKIHGIDPGISLFQILHNGAWRTINFDVDIAERIIELYNKGEKIK